ncbi:MULTISPECIES: P-loop NTPase fold protein [unclassified Lentimicrobium]|uniref:P-loop NTPase fold protein n=1 Tax=unclassified Lentimicrobium TaxID=2677434 RepID=UPI001556B6D4|nr:MULTISPECIES: P-loop NTPase fold protein [unclassified Lentimicrobium]NPD46778.1 uridine kinase [Lentimicrobium sp. S6]NPD85681.1 uridine kinase [Lentimicrobium sp. L6]
MLGDVLLITEKHINAAHDIVKVILEQKKNKFIIAISGESGSGKSELAHAVAKELKSHKITAKPLHIDNYYRILPLERTQWRTENGIETAVGLGEYDWDTIYRNVEEFKTGSKSTGPCVDLVTEQVDQLTTDYSEVDMLIIDGLYAVETNGVDLGVFIELTYHETKKAQKVRGKEPQNEYRARVLEQEHKVVQSIKPKAHLLVNMEYQVVKA